MIGINENVTDLLFFLTLKIQSTMFVKGKGSSVMNKTRSRLTFANKMMSLKSNVQNCLIERPSILDKSPPNIHCRPGIASVNGLHFVKTKRDSKSWSDNNGRPSPTGSIRPLTVISRYAACSSVITLVKFLFSSLSLGQLVEMSCKSFRISRKCCRGRWMNVVMSGRFFGMGGSFRKVRNSLLHVRDLLT